MLKRKPHLVPQLAARVATWYARRTVSDAPRPLSCGVYITNRCNLTCEMCNIFRHPDQGFLDAAVYRRLVEGLGRVGAFYMSLAGGEPLADPTLADRIALAKRHVPYVHLVTNGLALTERRVSELVEAGLDEISVSLDGTSEDHDRIRGLAGAFELSLRGLDALATVAPDLPVVINTVISPSNLGSLESLAELVRARGLLHKFQPVNDHPEFTGMESAAVRHEWTSGQVDQVRALIERLGRQDNVVNSPYFLAKIPAFLSGETHHGLFTAPCRYGTHHVEMTSDGRVYPCLTGLDWTNGFALTGELEDLLGSPEYRAAVERLTHCTGCRDNMYVCNVEPRLAFPIGNFAYYRMSALLGS